jgi:hypothetical protein
MRKTKRKKPTVPASVTGFMQALSSNYRKEHRDAAIEKFLELDEEDKLICVDAENNALFKAIEKGHGLELIKPLTLLTDENLLFSGQQTILNKALYGSSKTTTTVQLEVLNFILKYIKQKKLVYNVLEHLKFAVNYSTDIVAERFLKEYNEYLMPEVSQALLSEACISRLMPNCMKLLIQHGGVLSVAHAEVFKTGFNIIKYVPKEKELEKIIGFFREQKIEIPMNEVIFLNTDGVLGKEILAKSVIKGCSLSYWQQLEKLFGRLHFNGYTNIPVDLFNLDLIKYCYDSNPDLMLFDPENLVVIAYAAIKRGHPLIHNLLERGLNLDQIVPWKGRYNNFNISRFKISLGENAAFYSTDAKLFPKLQGATSRNIFKRNAAHYAALAMPLGSNKETSKSKKRTRNIRLPVSAVNPRITNSDSERYHAVPHNNFNFSLIGSSQAFANANLLHNAWVEDSLGFSPLFYAATHVDKTKRKEMLDAYKNLIKPCVSAILIGFPTVLIPIILNYVVDESGNPDLLVIDWAKALIFKNHHFTQAFTNLVTRHLTNYFDEKNNFIGSEKGIEEIRQAMYLFTIISLMEGESEYGSSLYIFNDFMQGENKHVQRSGLATSLHPCSSHQHRIVRIDNQLFIKIKTMMQGLEVKGVSPSSLERLIPIPGFLEQKMMSADLLQPEESPGESWSQPVPVMPDFSSSSSSSSSSHLPSPFKSSSSSQSFFPVQETKKRQRSEALTQPSVSWSESRDSLIERLSQCYQSGSRPKPDLKKALEPFIKQLEDADSEERVKQCLELINDTLDISNAPLQIAVDKYGLRQVIENLLEQTPQEDESERFGY